MKLKHPLADIFERNIKCVREGDIKLAQLMMRDCAVALREQLHDGRNNLAGLYAHYLAEVLDRLAESEKNARLFCLDMPKHRPRVAENPIHLERAKQVLATFQQGGTLDAAMSAVATAGRPVSIGAVRASWKAKGWHAMFELLFGTPRNKRNKLRSPIPEPKGGT